NGATLPVATNGIRQGVFDLGAIEGTLAWRQLVLAACLLETLNERLLGLVPDGVTAYAFFRARGHLVENLGEAKISVNVLQQTGKVGTFQLQLIFGAEDMAVILGKAAHAHGTMQRPAGLVAVTHAKFAIANGKFAVGVQSGIENLDVSGTVHRLDAVSPVFGLGREDMLGVVFPVAGALP